MTWFEDDLQRSKSCQIGQSVVHEAPNEIFVASEQLRVRLLKKADPKFIYFSAARKSGDVFGIAINRDSVVNDDVYPRTVLVKSADEQALVFVHVEVPAPYHQSVYW